MNLKSVLEKHKQKIPDFLFEAEHEVLASKKPQQSKSYKPNNSAVGPRQQNNFNNSRQQNNYNNRPQTSYHKDYDKGYKGISKIGPQ